MADLILNCKIALQHDNNIERILNTCLLVYDEEHFTDEALSNDIREQLEADPTLARIYVVAPRVKALEVIEQVRKGSSKLRSSLHENDSDSFLRLLVLDQPSRDNAHKLSEYYFVRATDENDYKEFNKIINPELCRGWLFDLFIQNQAMVLAPNGVHFGKTSGKHSDRFLRTANVLKNSAACRLIAFFCLPLLPKRHFRQIYVDTSPLLSVGLAFVEVSRIHGIAIDSGKIRSFGSYDGVSGDLDFRQSDLILISASTSGGLVKQLIDRGADTSAVITIYYLQAKDWPQTKGAVLADLTYKKNALFGFPEVASYKQDDCPYCKHGLILAEFEGDQFLLQRRKTRRLKVIGKSQSSSARVFFEMATRHKAISVLLVGTGRSRYSDLHFDVNALLEKDDQSCEDGLRSELSFKLRRTIPSPLDLIITDDCTAAELSIWSTKNNRSVINTGVKLVNANSLDTITPISDGGVLVYFSSLNGDLSARAINRSLRSIAPKGSIGYLATLLISESPETRRDLLSFLKYGDRGPSTFVFDSVHNLLISQRQERLPWDLEREHLARLAQIATFPIELQTRLDFLNANNCAIEKVFLTGQVDELTINPDFVYLDTTKNKHLISQADIYAVVSNLLAACRNDNREILLPVARGNEALIWEQSVYGQILLCPRNFKDYNDGILHAAFLRAAKSSELRYDTDETLSEEMLEIGLAEITAWSYGSGQALPELALAIATRRLSLKPKHLQEFLTKIRNTSNIPKWISFLLTDINV
jgi:hypothetical protein